MAETAFQISVPAPLLQFGIGKDEVQQRVNEWLVLSLFTAGRVSSGKAAKLLGISRVEFLDLLRVRGIAYIDCTQEELAEEFAAVESLEVKRRK